MPHLRTNHAARFVIFFSFLFAAAAAYGIQRPEKKTDLEKLVFARPELQILVTHQPLEKLSGEVGAKLKAELDLLGSVDAVKPVGFYDLRAGRLGTIVLSKPLLGKSGIGAMSASTDDQFRRQVWEAFRGYLATHKGQLAIDLEELGSEPRITVLEDRRIVQIHASRFIDGIPVRGSYVTAVVNSGNLILFGAKQWGDVAVSTQPSLTAEAALRKVSEYVRPHRIGGQWRDARLEILPVSAGDDLSRIKAGRGYLYRLVWAISPRIEEDRGSWEALVDAHSGEILSFADRNSYFDRKIRGGVYPISNDGAGAEGQVQTGWPMPFADVIQPFGTSIFSNSSGLVDDVGGILRTNLDGKYVRMNDGCGKIDEVASCTNLDLSSVEGTDCDVPAGHSAGDTHSSRTGFYEVNRIMEMARGWLPANTWLQDQITSNMNIPESCNAFWDGLTINFYRSSAQCRNTGEIAAVFDHEWGHGMDDNDALPTISTPGEAPADMYAMLRLNDSCIARGFFKNAFCDGAGDPCTECSGVRDADWAKRSSGLPHDVAWIVRPVDSPGVPGVVPPGGCVGATVPIPTVNSGPCLQGTHCEGSVVSEVVWDLIHRDLTAAPFNLDVNTALNLVARLQYLGGGNVDFWFQCDPSGLTGGCLPDGGYMNYLAIDDDDGNLANGTPHMTAIFNAFNRHGMACQTPAVINGGCAVKPAAAPNVQVTALPNGARLNWNPVPNAARYWVYRADGIHGCDFGKERIAITTATQHTDAGLLDGRTYYYTVEAVGAHDSCRSAASACDSVVPTASPVETEAQLAFREVANALAILSGDADPFIDNCETSRFSFQVENAGTVGLSNVRLVRVQSTSHPATQILTPLPSTLAASLAGNACGSIAPASFTFVPQGVSHNEPLDFEFEIQATSPLGPVNLIGRVSFTGNESDFEERASHTFHFEAASFEGWRTVSGNYTHQSPGANATLTHLASSALQPGQCDEIQSPEIRLKATSTCRSTTSSRPSREPTRPASTTGRTSASSTSRRVSGTRSSPTEAAPIPPPARAGSASPRGSPAGRARGPASSRAPGRPARSDRPRSRASASGSMWRTGPILWSKAGGFSSTRSRSRTSSCRFPTATPTSVRLRHGRIFR